MEHYHIVKITLPVVTSSCTINGNPGYGTPISCSDTLGSQTVVNRVYSFTDYKNPIPQSGIFKCVKSISETPPKLKGGSAVASRATASITFRDFVDDPNLDSPALVADPTIRSQGTFFGKLNKRQVIINKDVEIEYWKTDGFTHTLVKSNIYNSQGLKKLNNDEWSLSCSDILNRLSDDKARWPEEVFEELVEDITASSTTVKITNNNGIGFLGWINRRICVIGSDLMIITDAVNSATGVDLTVQRTSSIYIGDATSNPITIPPPSGTNVREIRNVPEEAKAGDSVFYPQVSGFVYDTSGNRLVANSVLPKTPIQIIDLVCSASNVSFTDSGQYDEYLPNSDIYTVFYESRGGMDWINEICSTYLLDVYSDLENDTVTYSATSQWATPIRDLVESRDFDYLTDKTAKAESFRYSRSVLRYGKFQLTASDEDVQFVRQSRSIDETYEIDELYGEQKTKNLGNTILLGNTDRDLELADTATIRHTNRFGAQPEEMVVMMNEKQLGDLKVADVVSITGQSSQGFSGEQEEKVVQISQIKPKFDVQRLYQVSMLTYTPDNTLVGSDAIYINQTQDLNLFVLAGSPPDSIERTFIFDGNQMRQGSLPQTVNIGGFTSGSTIHIVMLNGADFQAKGGDAGRGGSTTIEDTNIYGSGNDGLSGGTVISIPSTTSVTLNIYLSGNRTVQSASYNCDGNLLAPGGGGAGGGGSSSSSGAGGGGGVGRPFGLGASGGIAIGADTGSSGNNGTSLVGGTGGTFGPDGGDGGDYGAAGDNGDDGTLPGGTGGTGGAAGSAIIDNGSTVNVYGATIGTNYVQGNGDTPTFIA